MCIVFEFEIKYWSTLIEVAEGNIEELQKCGKKAKVSCESLDDILCPFIWIRHNAEMDEKIKPADKILTDMNCSKIGQDL